MVITNKLRPLRPPEPAWQATAPSDLTPLPGQPGAGAGRRPQPPLRETLKGLHTRELEGPTVFDQLFGPPTQGDPRLPRR
jgi:hypothetical protein